MDIISEELISNAKAREFLEGRGKEGELKYEQKNSLEILKKFNRIDNSKVEELVAELRKIEKLRDRQVMNIINFLPEDRDDLRAVLHKDYSSLTDEEIDAVLKTVKRYI